MTSRGVSPERLPDDATVHTSTWSSPERDLWVAESRGSFVGMIERAESAFHARDGRGGTIGVFTSLQDARQALAHPTLHSVHDQEPTR